MNFEKIILMILDGWGYGKVETADAIKQAKTPFFDSLIERFPNSTLTTFGEAVGLPEGQMGNSEVGHLNIGAGRIVYQQLAKIHKMVEENTFAENEVLNKAIKYAKTEAKTFHLIGLVSDGGIHSHTNHLQYLMHRLKAKGVEKVVIHCITDGRDTDPKSGKNFVEQIVQLADNLDITVATVCGRYYAMDRDKRWERIKLAYDLLVKGEGKKAQNLIDAIDESYAADVTDEFIKPIVKVDENGNAVAKIEADDVVFCFNFRTDRCRQITQVLTQENFEEFDMQTLSLKYLTMTEYDADFKNVNVVVENEDLKNTLGEVLQNAGKTQLRMAETEKYPHVTFFFNGGREEKFEGETRIMANSPKVATYDLQPEMSAPELNQKLIANLKEHDFNFICINFANPDMVGHTGDFEAAKKAVETVDNCMKNSIPLAIEKGYLPIIIADHGNADFMINENGTPNTAHTTNLVPVIFCNENLKANAGKLGDLAPTILKLLNVEIPEEMTGDILCFE